MSRKSGAALESAKARKNSERTRIGEIFAGRYRLERLLDRGKIGERYLAVELALERKIALVIFSRDFSEARTNSRERFYREAAACARIAQPSLAVVHDFGASERNELFQAAEYVEGHSLAEVLEKEGALSVERAVNIALALARSLRYAHQAGIVHRSLEPAKIILSTRPGSAREDVVLLDLGLAKLVETALREREEDSDMGIDLASGGVLFGSTKYLSPEQICGDRADGRADIYALGALLFHMLSGEAPFHQGGASAILRAHLSGLVPALGSTGKKRSCPEGLEAIVRRCLEKLPAARYASMDALIAALVAFSAARPRAIPAEAPAAPRARSTSTAGAPQVPERSSSSESAAPAVYRSLATVVGAGAEEPPSVFQDDTAAAATPKRKARKLSPLFLVAGLSAAAAAILYWLSVTSP